MAVKTLIPSDLINSRVLVKTDNIGSMFALLTGKTRDPVLAACACELWLFTALRGLDILITHVPGESLVLANALSRAILSVKAESLVAMMSLSYAKPVALTCVLSASL